LTPEVERDLQLIRLRNVLDPKRFYKKDSSILSTSHLPGSSKDKNTKSITPFFQLGTIMDSPLDPHNRLTKKERKHRIIDELMADANSRTYFKKKFMEVQVSRAMDSQKGSMFTRGKRKHSWEKSVAAMVQKSKKPKRSVIQ
jgi:hypothetical protein